LPYEKFSNKIADFKLIGQNQLQIESLNQQKTFKFDKIFRTSSKQHHIFDELKPLVQSSMEGYNVCILSYGQTGSGKTYTMVGDDKNPGLYFTSVDEVYRKIKES